jgi:glutamyl-tRNA synthetase
LVSAIKYFCVQLDQLEKWKQSAIYALLKQTMDRYQLKPNQLFQTLRILLVGATISPPMDITIELLGKKRTLARLSRVIPSES